MAQTVITLRTCTNLRDVGGCRTPSGRVVRHGLLFRSDSLHKLDDADASSILTTVAPRTVLDLRSAEEVLRYGTGPLGSPIRHVHVPVGVDAPGTLRARRWQRVRLLDVYARMAEDSGPAIARVVRALGAKDALPAVVFCAAGKDRTGVVMALILGALNVTDDDIVVDYAMTAPVDPQLLGDGYVERLAHHPPDFLRAAPETMRGFLDAVRRRHGSVRAYLARHGIGRNELCALERALLARD